MVRSARENLLFLLPAAALAVLVYGWPFDGDFDVYGHLLRGRVMMESGSVVATDPFSFTAWGQPDELHSWLGQVLLWTVYSLTGPIGLKATLFVVVLATAFLCFEFVRRQTQQVGAALLATTLFLWIEREQFSFQPSVFGELSAAILIFVLLDYQRRPTWSQVVGVLAVVAAWANLHGSVLVALPMVGAYAFAQYLHPQKGRRRPIAQLSVLVLGTLIATFLTPNGTHLISQGWSLGSLGRACQIGEWMPKAPISTEGTIASGLKLKIHIDPTSLIQLLASALVLIQVIRTRHKEPVRFVQWALLTLFFGLLPLVAQRNRVFLGFTAAFAAVVAVEWLREWEPKSLLRSRWPAALCSVLALWGLGYHHYPASADGLLPLRQFMKATQLQGKAFNHPDWGNYLSFHFYPWIRTAMDGRLWVHRELLSVQAEQVKAHGAESNHLLLEKLPQAELVVEHSVPAWETRFDPKAWIAVFENNQSVVLLRREVPQSENLRKVEEYYHALGIPFDIQSGFDASKIFENRPDWIRSIQARPEWGRWPEEDLRDRLSTRYRDYYHLRNLPDLSEVHS